MLLRKGLPCLGKIMIYHVVWAPVSLVRNDSYDEEVKEIFGREKGQRLNKITSYLIAVRDIWLPFRMESKAETRKVKRKDHEDGVPLFSQEWCI